MGRVGEGKEGEGRRGKGRGGGGAVNRRIFVDFYLSFCLTKICYQTIWPRVKGIMRDISAVHVDMPGKIASLSTSRLLNF